MEAGGNQRLSDFLSKVGVCAPSSIRDRYSHPFLLLYRSHIAALGEENESDTLSTEALRQVSKRALFVLNYYTLGSCSYVFGVFVVIGRSSPAVPFVTIC